jgi:uncharacterized protein (TIGR03382 family)
VPSRGCIDDPCAAILCGTGERCVADTRGNAQCTNGGMSMMPDAGPIDAGTTRVLASGGGCTASGRGSMSWLALLALSALFFSVRRRGAR